MSNSTKGTVVVKKRERTQNWVPEEKKALFNLIKAHVSAIENKKIDAAASAMKTIAWQQVFGAFQGRFSTERDVTRMREQWRRMKAQARLEMYTFAEKVRSLGPEEASKSRPSNLSIEVWKLMEDSRKQNDEPEISDDNTQAVDADSKHLQTVLPDVVNNSPSEFFSHHSKIKNTSEEFYKVDNDNKPTNCSGLSYKHYKLSEQQTETNNPERAKGDENWFKNLKPDEVIDEDEGMPQLQVESDQPGSTRNMIWIFKTVQKEHDLKLKMLNIELERAQLRKQIASNELKTSNLKRQLLEDQAVEFYSQVRMSGEPGSGAGKGGGGGGTIREAGGSFGKMEAAREDQYFYNQQKEQLNQLRDGLHDEISFHEEQIKRHQEAIARHKSRIGNIEKK